MSHRSGSLLGFAARVVLSSFFALGILLFLRASANADWSRWPNWATRHVLVDPQFTDRSVDVSESVLLQRKSDCSRQFVVSPSFVGLRLVKQPYPGIPKRRRSEQWASGGPGRRTTEFPADRASTTFNRPTGVAVDSGGNLYVADNGNNRILVFPSPFAINANTGQTTGFAPFAGNWAGWRFLFQRLQPGWLPAQRIYALYSGKTDYRRVGEPLGHGHRQQPCAEIQQPVDDRKPGSDDGSRAAGFSQRSGQPGYLGNCIGFQ